MSSQLSAIAATAYYIKSKKVIDTNYDIKGKSITGKTLNTTDIVVNGEILGLINIDGLTVNQNVSLTGNIQIEEYVFGGNTVISLDSQDFAQDLSFGKFAYINENSQLRTTVDQDPWIILPLTGNVVALADGGYGQLGDKLYLLGGSRQGYSVFTNVVYEIDLTMLTMEPLVTTGSGPPDGLAFNPYSAVAPNTNDVYMYGGWNGGPSLSGVLYRFHAPTREWFIITATNSPGQRAAGDMTIYGNYLYLFGGFNFSRGYNNNDMFRLDLTNPVAWETIIAPGTLPPGRTDYIWTVYQNKSILFGGATSGSSSINDLWEFSYVNHTWTQLQSSNDTVLQPRRAVGAKGVVIEDYLYLYGGSVISQVYDEYWTLHIPTHTWTLINASGQFPLYRGYIGILPNNRELFNFGGFKSVNSGNSSTLFHFNRPRPPIGMIVATTQTLTGNVALVQTDGVACNELWNLIPGLAVYAESSGNATQVIQEPYSNFVGIAISSNKITF